MKIVVINGTQVKGCTYAIKETFLGCLRDGNPITEFYLPVDCPHFCTGCKACFVNDERMCPHAAQSMPIWEAMLDADLLVFAYPVYVLRAPGQVKALLDHFGCHWMVHRPDKRMFGKRAVILTQSFGAPNGAAQKDVATSLGWLGVSDVARLGFGLMEGIVWNEISKKRRDRITAKVKRLASRYKQPKVVRMSMKVKMYFFISRMLHKNTLKGENPISTDNQHWIDNGWIGGAK